MTIKTKKSRVRHAYWILCDEPKVVNPVYKCSNCCKKITVDKPLCIDIGFWIDEFKWCLNCGAKMNGVIE